MADEFLRDANGELVLNEFGQPILVQHEHEDEDEAAPEAIKKWSTVSPSLFAGVREEMLLQWAEDLSEELGIDVGLSDLPIDRTGANRALNAYAEAFRTEHGRFPDSIIEVNDDPQSWIRLAREGSNAETLPEQFRVPLPEGGFAYFLNLPDTVYPVQVTEDEFSTKVVGDITSLVPPRARPRRTLQSGVDPGGERAIPDFGANRARGSGLEPLEEPDIISADEVLDRIRNFPTDVIETFRGLSAPAIIDADTLGRILGRSTITTSGGGGGVTRQPVAFDRAELTESIRGQWRSWMREEPGNLEGLVSEFEASANAAWLNRGERKNLEVWIKNRMRSTSRYDLLYGKKDQSQSEEDYLGGFLSAEQFGLHPRVANREVVRGLTNDPAPASFTESVAFGRDVQALGQGTFSRRFAQMIDGLGSLQRA